MFARIRGLALAAIPAAAIALMAQRPVEAAPIQLGFILDSSGSIGSSNWSTITSGLATAISSVVPQNGTYEITVVKFSTTAATVVAPTILTAANAAAVATSISGTSFLAGNTNYAAAFTLMQSLLTPTIAASSASYVNFATDGEPNTGGNGISERNALIAAGVDNLSIEGIGSGVDANFLRNSICYPGPCTNAPMYNFPTQGFYLAVANANSYANAIGEKIQVITNVPEPLSIALFGMGLAGLGVVVRRRAQAM